MNRPPKIVAYLAHPLGAGMSPDEIARRRDNIANALAWMRFLIDATTWAISVPWLPYVQVLDEGIYRDRGIADDLAGLERADLLVGTGGRWSPGMLAERDHAASCGMPIVDLTSWGFSPPTPGDSAVLAALTLRTRHAFNGRPRRVWMPPLEHDEIGELKGNRSILRAHHGEVDFGVLSAIIDAAEAVDL